MQPNEKSCHGVKVPPCSFVVGGEGGLFFCGEWTVCPLFAFHLDSGQQTFHANFGRGRRGVGVQSKKFPMLSSFHLCRWAKGEDHYNSKQNLLFWGTSINLLFLSDGLIKLPDCPKKKKKERSSEAPHLVNAKHNMYG